MNNSYICVYWNHLKEGVDSYALYYYWKKYKVTPGLRDAVQEKLGKLECYFTPDTEIYATLSVQKDVQKIEVTIPVKGSIIRAEESSNDMYVSIDLVEEIIERQIRRYRKKTDRQKAGCTVFLPALY